MDEIDAALDFRNVSIVANYIKDRTKNAQFIIISLRYVGSPCSLHSLPDLSTV
jgi:chromosome segregation ATPase